MIDTIRTNQFQKDGNKQLIDLTKYHASNFIRSRLI